MIQDWNAYRSALIGRVGDLAALSPDAIRGWQTIDGAAAATGKLDRRTHELIALAVAVTTRCDGCITVHAKQAREEIAEALSVAIAMNTGAAVVYSARVLDAVDAL
jgi:AhpD family alkylhydroperoxidase